VRTNTSKRAANAALDGGAALSDRYVELAPSSPSFAMLLRMLPVRIAALMFLYATGLFASDVTGMWMGIVTLHKETLPIFVGGNHGRGRSRLPRKSRRRESGEHCVPENQSGQVGRPLRRVLVVGKRRRQVTDQRCRSRMDLRPGLQLGYRTARQVRDPHVVSIKEPSSDRDSSRWQEGLCLQPPRKSQRD